MQLKVMECWELVIGTESQPPNTAPAGADAAAIAAVLAFRKSWDKRRDGACAAIITSISDEELHVVHGIDEDPFATWTRLKEKFERRSEQESEAAFMRFLDFSHTESETANEMFERYETSKLPQSGCRGRRQYSSEDANRATSGAVQVSETKLHARYSRQQARP